MKNNEKFLFQISEAARACGVSRSTLLRMEEKGLLKPAYVSEEKETKRRLLGSENQRILCLTDRYKNDVSWFDTDKNGKSVEVNMSDKIVINGDKI